ncbi:MULTISPECIES: hypothetical protein [unclassified Nocardioides]|uniref:hypothetical protein n=1 Tax=unclassified Nocardioides TaxID=2615069 RepID=UPI000701E45B|nr:MULTISPECIES: hypothetical protein [unclassified Nocardioides]KRA27852.1 hypothetical protein ASD81_24160 [Nocardioides sp. Root614]KRA86685.1 hypothetical protein ASD84_20960 [Nocardioides sp. Root682]
MTNWDELTDDELMSALAEAVTETDPSVVDRRRAAAQAAFTWRTIDTELAELLHDSALEAGAAVRSAAEGPRSLSFGRSGLTLEIEIDGDQVLGEVIAEGAAGDATGAAVVVLRRPDADDVTVEADAAGFFRFSDVGPGSVRFEVTRGEWSLTTPWVTL